MPVAPVAGDSVAGLCEAGVAGVIDPSYSRRPGSQTPATDLRSRLQIGNVPTPEYRSRRARGEPLAAFPAGNMRQIGRIGKGNVFIVRRLRCELSFGLSKFWLQNHRRFAKALKTPPHYSEHLRWDSYGYCRRRAARAGGLAATTVVIEQEASAVSSAER